MAEKYINIPLVRCNIVFSETNKGGVVNDELVPNLGKDNGQKKSESVPI